MKKLTKLNLSDLKVESFVTSLEDKNSQTVKGGVATTIIVSPVSFSVTITISIVIKKTLGND